MHIEWFLRLGNSSVRISEKYRTHHYSAEDKSNSSAPVCRFCTKKGHIMSDCFKPKQRHQHQYDSKPTSFISKSCNLPSYFNDVVGTILEEKFSSDSVMQCLNHLFIMVLCRFQAISLILTLLRFCKIQARPSCFCWQIACRLL